MSEIKQSGDFGSEMTEDAWVRNKKAILKGIDQNRDIVKNYSIRLLSDKLSLMESAESLENENYKLMGEVKDLEMQLLGKENEEKIMLHKLNDARKNIVKPIADENSYISEISFLESEQSDLIYHRDSTIENLNENMRDLSNTILDIEFIKGEIHTLVSKIDMIESDIPGIFSEIDELDEQISSTSKSLTDLYNRMKIVEKSAKTFYYKNK